MNLLERTEKFKVNTEEAAKDLMENLRKNASENGYLITKIGYVYKSKKEDECYVVTVTKKFLDLWEV